MLTRSPQQATGIDRLADGVLSGGSGLYTRFAVPIGVALFSAYVLLTAAAAVVLPDANWDMLPYIAAAGEATHPTPEALHDYAYGAVKDAVPAADYLALSDDGGGYRSHMASDP